jgi:hypothetical protein
MQSIKQFINLPLDKKMNRQNVMTRIERLEDKTGPQPSARVGSLAELAQVTGDLLVTGRIIIRDPATGGMGVGLTENGIAIREGASGQSFVSFYNSAGTEEQYALKISGGSMQMQNLIQGGAVSFLLELTNASTPYVKWYESTGTANQTYLEIQSGAAGLRTQFGYDHYIDTLALAGTGSAAVTFNERGHDIDFIAKDDADVEALKVDAALHQVLVYGKNLSALSGRHYLPFGVFTHISPITVSGSNPYTASVNAAMTFIKWTNAANVATTNNGSNYWTLDLRKTDGATDSIVATMTTSALTAGTWGKVSTTTFSPTSITTAQHLLYINVTTTGAPGALSMGGPSLEIEL